MIFLKIKNFFYKISCLLLFSLSTNSKPLFAENNLIRSPKSFFQKIDTQKHKSILKIK
jgi:hypothetical protein